MDAGIKARWIAALRSGEYEQAYGQLRSNKGYCCLGVLSEIAVDAGVITKERIDTGDGWTEAYGNGSSGYLPSLVRDWAGLPDTNPLVQADGRGQSLAWVNDHSGKTFTQIADLIEEHL